MLISYFTYLIYEAFPKSESVIHHTLALLIYISYLYYCNLQMKILEMKLAHRDNRKFLSFLTAGRSLKFD